jgi:hypothetical protein
VKIGSCARWIVVLRISGVPFVTQSIAAIPESSVKYQCLKSKAGDVVRSRFFIHTWLQPGVVARGIEWKPFKRFPIAAHARGHLAKARCE